MSTCVADGGGCGVPAANCDANVVNMDGGVGGYACVSADESRDDVGKTVEDGESGGVGTLKVSTLSLPGKVGE